MSQVHVVVDSTANIPKSMLEKYNNLHIVPLKVSLNDNQWLDHDITVKELFDMVEQTKSLPRTSQPAPGDFAAVFKPLVEAGKDIVVITLDSALSGTIQSAKTAVQLLKAKNIFIVDSGTAAVGIMRMARTALEMAEQGFSAAAIADHIAKVVKKTHTMFIVDTLHYLHKGGRIGGAATLIGSILQIKPILYLVDGKVAVLDKVRSKQKAVKRMLEEIHKYTNIKEIGVAHIEVWNEAEALRDTLKNLYPDIPITVTDGGAVLASHLGPGVIGVVLEERID